MSGFRLTDNARRVRGTLRKKGELSKLGAHDVLLSLLAEDTFAAALLSRAGMDRGMAQQILTNAAEPHPDAECVFKEAANESRRLGDRHVGTEHLLLALVHSANGATQEVLNSVRLDETRVKELIVECSEQVRQRRRAHFRRLGSAVFRMVPWLRSKPPE